MEHKCIYESCNQVFSSEKKLAIHITFSHEAYRSGESISIASINSLEKIKDQVRLILIKFPSTRSNDKMLYEKLLQYFHSNLIEYDHISHMIKPANRVGWTISEWLSFPSYETCRRSRQALAERARKHIKAGLGTREDEDMLPSEKVAIQRDLKEEAYRRYFIEAR